MASKSRLEKIKQSCEKQVLTFSHGTTILISFQNLPCSLVTTDITRIIAAPEYSNTEY